MADGELPDFPVVGVGASAGGLEAYRRFLTSLPADTGAAFVFIQHLDPHHDSMMADLLSKYTSMPVRQADVDMPVKPNHVYIIPPNKFIKLVNHGLFLEEPVKEKGIRLSIDHFFRSVAEVREERAIGILLSGTGSDGSLGLREIKAAGGLAMVQKPSTAEYDGMPRAAIQTGVVDYVLPVEEMPDALVKFIKHPYLDASEKRTGFADASPDYFRAILNLLRTQTQYDFRSYKKGTLERRIQRRMGLKQIGGLQEYVDYLRRSPDEITQLFKDLLIGVTRFFRDEEAWTALEKQAIAPMIQGKSAGEPLRAWIPGCASGEEAYTVAMVLFNQLDIYNKALDLQVFATDLNEEAIATARAGVYPSAIAGDVPEHYLKKFFVKDGESYHVNKRLRETVVFATQNVISDPPFSKLDLITCRNLMIYLEPDVQTRMIEMFHFALGKKGVLFLGPSESGERPGRLFDPIAKTHRIYQKIATARAKQGSFPIVPSRDRDKSATAQNLENRNPASGAEVAKRYLLKRFAPASVLVDHAFEIQYFHGPVRDYLDFPAGEPTMEVTEIALDGLRSKLRALLSQVADVKERVEMTARNIRRHGTELNIRITAEPVKDPSAGNLLYLVSFEDASDPRDSDEVEAKRKAAKEASTEDESFVEQLEYELQATKEDLQSTIEEMETANEELKASNEEVMSMNEELQSTNEELETSREELQSLNEELSTVNSQLEEKITEVEASNNDLSNLLRSTNIATIFLDTDLCIRRFTPATRDLMRIIDSDVGRPVEDLATRVNDSELYADAQRVLDKLQPAEAEVRNSDGNFFIRRIQPYRTSENKIEGVVVTFTDVTQLRKSADAARRRELQQEAISRLGQKALSIDSLDGLFEQAVYDLARHLDVKMAKILELDEDKLKFGLRAGVGWKEGLVGTAYVDAGAASQAGYTLQRAGPVIVHDFMKEKRFSAPKLLIDHDVTCGASVIIGPSSAPWGVLGAHDSKVGACSFDVDDVNFMQAMANILWLAISQLRWREEVERERKELRDFTNAMAFQLAVVDAEERYLLVNDAYQEWGRKPKDVEGLTIREVLGPAAYKRAKPYIEKVLNGSPQRFELELDMGDGESRVNLVSYAPRRNENREITGFYSAAVDITPQKIAERDLAERTAQYETIGESIPFGVWICDEFGSLQYVSPSFLDMVGMTEAQALEFGWAGKLAAGTAEPTLAAWDRCVANGEDWTREHQFIDKNGDIVTVLSLGRPIRNEDGKITSWSGLNLDITERKKKEERMQMISAELDHRVKNILATVSSIARLSGRKATSLEKYRHDFDARIQALSRAHQVLAQSKWEGMQLRMLVENELQPYTEIAESRTEVEGEEVVLTPAAAQSMALILHELATNAVKYGALASKDGNLSISWKLSREGGETALRFRWVESGLTGVEPPEKTGFGTTVIQDVIQSQCDAEVKLDFTPSGFEYDLKLPSGSLRRN